MNKKQVKWQKIRKESEANLSVGPIITEAQTNRLYRNTQIGSPVDTTEELDIQTHNLGPKDNPTEINDLKTSPDKKTRSDELEVKSDDSTEDNKEHFSPKLRR